MTGRTFNVPAASQFANTDSLNFGLSQSTRTEMIVKYFFALLLKVCKGPSWVGLPRRKASRKN